MTEGQQLRLFFKKALIVLAMVTVVWLLATFRSLVIALLLALIVSAALTPVVEWGERRRIPRHLTVIAVVLGAILVVGGLGAALLPTLITQGELLAHNLPMELHDLPPRLAHLPVIGPYVPHLSTLGSSFQSGVLQGVQVLGVAATSIGHLVLVAVLAIFIILDAPVILRTILQLLPDSVARPLEGQIPEMSARLSNYVIGQGIISGILAIIGFLVLIVFHVPYALLLGVTLGIVSILPLIGPFLGMLPGVVVALFMSPLTALWVFIVLYVSVHAVTTFIAPIIFRKSVNIHPLVMLLAVTIGAELGGIGGAVVAVPVAAAIQVLVVNLYLVPKLAADQLDTCPPGSAPGPQVP